MYNHILDLLKKILGITLIVIGIISGFIPILQGWLFIFAGLLLLGVKKETIYGWVKKAKLHLKRFRKPKKHGK